MPDDGGPVAASSDGGAEASVRELSELRDLLFGAERRQLDELRRRLDTSELSPEELAEKLPQAVALRSGRDHRLAVALAPTIETAIGESVRRNPHEIATAIFPVLGPAIRKAIAETMAGLVNTINSAIESSLSLRGIRWRVESWRTGVPFAQIVIRHALVYRVEQVFLVHAETGLLLAHVPDSAATDPDLISGMLTAIGDFVADSFEPRHTGELRAFAVGDLTVLVEPGPQAYVAAVVRGQPPETLLPRLQTTLETIHLQYAAPLASFEGDATPFVPARPLLEDCVETVLSTDKPTARAGIARWAWLVALGAIVAGLAWWTTRGTRQWNAAVERLEADPGVVVLRTDRRGGRWHLDGMRDPLAADPAVLLGRMGIDTTAVVARWEPYVSTEPAIALARARRTLAPPGGVALSLDGDALVATGRAPSAWVARAEVLAPAIPGVASIDVSGVQPGLPDELEALRTAVESRQVLFAIGAATLDDSAVATTAAVAARFAELAAAAQRHRYRVSLELVGRADPSGSEVGNLGLSRRRVAGVRDLLTSRGVPASAISDVAFGSTNPIAHESPADRARLNRSVSFLVRAQPTGGASPEVRGR